MASKTKKVEYIRERKRSTKGKYNKAVRRNKGTTLSEKELFGDK